MFAVQTAVAGKIETFATAGGWTGGTFHAPGSFSPAEMTYDEGTGYMSIGGGQLISPKLKPVDASELKISFAISTSRHVTLSVNYSENMQDWTQIYNSGKITFESGGTYYLYKMFNEVATLPESVIGKEIYLMFKVEDTDASENALDYITIPSYASSQIEPAPTVGGDIKFFDKDGKEITEANEGDTVSVKATPEAGNMLESIVIKDADGNDVTVTFDMENKTITFVMPGKKITVTASFIAKYLESVSLKPAKGSNISDSYNGEVKKGAFENQVPKKLDVTLEGSSKAAFRAAAADYTITEPLVVAGKVIINGNGAVIDCSGLTSSFIQMDTTNVAKNSKGYWEADSVYVKGVKLAGLQSYFYDDMTNPYIFSNFVIDNCIFELATTKSIDTPFRFRKGGPVLFAMKESTMYQTAEGNVKYLVKISDGNFPDKVFDSFAGPYTWDIENNTFVGVFSSKQLLNGGRVSNNYKKTSVTLLNNIFYNCYADGNSFLKNLFGGKYGDTLKDFVKVNTAFNTYMTNDAAVAGLERYDEGFQVKSNPGFVSASTGDFTLNANSKQAKHKVGDTEWLVDYVALAKDMEDINMVFTKEDHNGGGSIINLTNAINTRVAEITALDYDHDKVIGNIYIDLSFNEKYKVTAPIVANKGIIIKGGNAIIDASELTQPFIQMNSTPIIAKTESGQYLITDSMKIQGLHIQGITKALFADNGKPYAYDNFTVFNNWIEYETQKNVVLNLASSMAIKFDMARNTFWSKQAGTSNFFAMSGKRPWQITGYESSKGQLNVENNTFYNMATSKQFMNTNTLKGQKNELYTFNSNIFYNTSNKKIYGNITNNKQQLTTDGKNTYYMEETGFFNETNYNGDEGLKTNPYTDNAGNAIVDITQGDFTVYKGAKQQKYKTGDLRWLTHFDPALAPIENVYVYVNDGENMNTSLAAAIAAAGIDQVGFIQMDLAAGDEGITVTSSIEAPLGIYINGSYSDLPTIDASALEGPMVTTPSAQPAEITNANYIAFANMKVKGLKTALFKSATKNYLYNFIETYNVHAELAGDATTIDFSKGSAAANVYIDYCTFYAPTATTKAFYSSQGGQKITEFGEEMTQNFYLFNNTMYNLTTGKNFFTHRSSNQKWLTYNVQNNIFVNCGKSGQTIRGLNGGQGGKNPTWSIVNNAFNADGADTSAKESTGDETEGEEVTKSVAGTIAFTDAAAGDFNGVFTLADGAGAPEVAIGAALWTITYTTANGEAVNAPEGDATAIDTIEADGLNNAVIYNLNGQRVEKAEKGLYIINGKKVVIK